MNSHTIFCQANEQRGSRLYGCGRMLRAGLVMLLAALLFVPIAEAQTPQETLENQILVIQVPNRLPRVMEAPKVEMFDLVVAAHGKDGIASRMQRDFVVAIVADLPEDLSPLSEDRLVELSELYKQTMSDFAETAPLLKIREQRIREELNKREQERKAKQAEIQEAKELFMADEYDADLRYDAEYWEAKQEAAKLLLQLDADLRGEIEDYLQPWSDHFQKLRDGFIRRDGQWVSREVLLQEREQEREQAFVAFAESVREIPFPVTLLPQNSVLLFTGIILFLMLLILGMLVNIARSNGNALDFTSALILLFGVIMLGAYGYFAYLIFSGPTQLRQIPGIVFDEEVGEDSPLLRALYISAADITPRYMRESDNDLILTEGQINAFLEQRLRFSGSMEPEFFDMEHAGLAVRFGREDFVIYNQVVVMGMSFVVQYHMSHRQLSDHIEIVGKRVVFGGAPLPGFLANHFWRAFLRQQGQILEQSGLSEYYGLSVIRGGEIEIKLGRIPPGLRRDRVDAAAEQDSNQTDSLPSDAQ